MKKIVLWYFGGLILIGIFIFLGFVYKIYPFQNYCTAKFPCHSPNELNYYEDHLGNRLDFADKYFNEHYANEGGLTSFERASTTRNNDAVIQDIFLDSTSIASVLLFNVSNEYYRGTHLITIEKGSDGYYVFHPGGENTELILDLKCITLRNCNPTSLFEYSKDFLVMIKPVQLRVDWEKKLAKAKTREEYIPISVIKYVSKEKGAGLKEVELYLDDRGRVLASRQTAILVY